MKKRLFVLYFLIFINISLLFGESGAGYYFRFNNFRLFMDFNDFALDDYLDQNEEYINSSKCFYSLFQTLYYYKNELETENITINLYQFNNVPIKDDKIVIYIQKDGIKSTYDYFVKSELSYEENIYLILNNFLSFSIIKQSVDKIKLYRISVNYKDYEKLGWIYNWNMGNLFFGTFLSYFYDYETNEYVAYFFSKEDAVYFLEQNNLTNNYLKELEITKDNVYTVFGLLVN